MFPVLYSPNEPENFLGFFTSWIRIRICDPSMRIRIQEAYLYADPDPKHIPLLGPGYEAVIVRNRSCYCCRLNAVEYDTKSR